MKILLVANYIPDYQQSMQRFAKMLERGLVEAGHDVRVIRPAVIAGKLSYNGVTRKWLGYIDKLVFFPSALRKAAGWADVIHICDHSNSFYVEHLKGCGHIVTCHDLFGVRSALGQIPQQSTAWTGRRLQRMILAGLRAAQHIVCDSDATKQDVFQVAQVAESKVSRIYLGLNYSYSPMERREAESRLLRLGIATNVPYLLHVGGNHWYKNRPGVLEIFSLLGQHSKTQHFRLVMVGEPWTPRMRQFVRERKIEHVVQELVGIDEEDLRAVYSLASMLLFPSIDEGFGWPILEAQACGCPVVTSNRRPMTEVGGNAACYVDPTDPASAVNAIYDVLQSPDNYRERGFRNVARFSTFQSIQSYADVYKLVCPETRPALVRAALNSGPVIHTSV